MQARDRIIVLDQTPLQTEFFAIRPDGIYGERIFDKAISKSLKLCSDLIPLGDSRLKTGRPLFQ